MTMTTQQFEKAREETLRKREKEPTAVSQAETALPATQGRLSMQKLTAAIRGLIEVVDHESGLLEQYRNPDYSEINARKARGIRVLNQTMTEYATELNEMERVEVEQHLATLQVRLDRNRVLLEMHLDAVGEMAQLLQQAYDEQEADGTYDPASLQAALKASYNSGQK
ncbi:MAG: Hypothetical protein BHV28_02000 [Candidatus Tokpelaia hoelldobleri]|uniref:Uncharacterized protein n=1 Tax=Candidatus Tokpelaia hoelldobleri TaxID=1902579 RepID=A0A1U9JST7_9HYPH|nr:MAG: Hypothetical protein BHV28_02000 [Candidatus Tokpelaia hoelldoblerii]